MDFSSDADLIDSLSPSSSLLNLNLTSAAASSTMHHCQPQSRPQSRPQSQPQPQPQPQQQQPLAQWGNPLELGSLDEMLGVANVPHPPHPQPRYQQALPLPPRPYMPAPPSANAAPVPDLSSFGVDVHSMGMSMPMNGNLNNLNVNLNAQPLPPSQAYAAAPVDMNMNMNMSMMNSQLSSIFDSTIPSSASNTMANNNTQPQPQPQQQLPSPQQQQQTQIQLASSSLPPHPPARSTSSTASHKRAHQDMLSQGNGLALVSTPATNATANASAGANATTTTTPNVTTTPSPTNTLVIAPASVSAPSTTKSHTNSHSHSHSHTNSHTDSLSHSHSNSNTNCASQSHNSSSSASSAPCEPAVIGKDDLLIDYATLAKMGGLSYAELYKERAREAFKEAKKSEHLANGNFDRMKRRKKNDTSMTPREKYVRRLRMNQDSAAAARHAQEVYVQVLEKLVGCSESERKNFVSELNMIKQHNSSLESKVCQLEGQVTELQGRLRVVGRDDEGEEDGDGDERSGRRVKLREVKRRTDGNADDDDDDDEGEGRGNDYEGAKKTRDVGQEGQDYDVDEKKQDPVLLKFLEMFKAPPANINLSGAADMSNGVLPARAV